MTCAALTAEDLRTLVLGISFLTIAGVVFGGMFADLIRSYFDRRQWRKDRREFLEACAPGATAYPAPGCAACAHGWEKRQVGDPCPSCGLPLVNGHEAFETWFRAEYPKHFTPKTEGRSNDVEAAPSLPLRSVVPPSYQPEKG